MERIDQTSAWICVAQSVSIPIGVIIQEIRRVTEVSQGENLMLQTFVQGVVALPDQLQAAITLLVIFLVGWLFAKIAVWVPWLGEFLGQYKDQVSMAVSSALVLYAQQVLNTIPAQFDPIVTIVLQLIVAILVFLGVPLAVFKFLRSKRVPGFRE
jgi:hypothetical protein